MRVAGVWGWSFNLGDAPTETRILTFIGKSTNLRKNHRSYSVVKQRENKQHFTASEAGFFGENGRWNSKHSECMQALW